MEEPRVFKKETHNMWGHRIEYIGIAKSIRIKDAMDHFRNLLGQAEELKPKEPEAEEAYVWPDIHKKPEKKIRVKVEEIPERKKGHISNLEDTFESMDRNLGTKSELLVRKTDGVSKRVYVLFNAHQMGDDNYVFHIKIENANQDEREKFHKAFEELSARNFGGQDPGDWYKFAISELAARQRKNRDGLSQ